MRCKSSEQMPPEDLCAWKISVNRLLLHLLELLRQPSTRPFVTPRLPVSPSSGCASWGLHSVLTQLLAAENTQMLIGWSCSVCLWSRLNTFCPSLSCLLTG
ncbi:uncharacterized protein LOC708686 isoform X2 [Macaca mulatta]